VMRIIQEGVTNTIRHARASRVTISIRKSVKELVLNVADNGCGITPEQMASTKAYGLMGMQERARLCRGTVEISGVPGCGTNLRLTIPLESGDNGS
jgi:signal transduction histidine kinase